MAVAPTASWFEYLDIAGAVLTERLLPVDGMVTARGPGLGLDRDEHAVARYAFCVMSDTTCATHTHLFGLGSVERRGWEATVNKSVGAADRRRSTKSVCIRH